MNSRRSASENAAFIAAGTVALLLLGAWSAPSLAANAFTVHCEESCVELPNLEMSIDSLAAGPLDLTQRTEIVLQKVFEDDDVTFDASPDLKPLDTHDKLPLASTEIAPAADTLDTGSRSENVSKNSADASATETAVPDVHDADLLRFRNQMFRTDI